MATGLAVSDVVAVSVTLTPVPAQQRSFGSLLIVGSSPVIDTNERLRGYTSLIGVATDFGTVAPEYQAADLFFSQNPQPTQLYIGRWAETATSGVLHGAYTPPTLQVLSNFTNITNGSMAITIDGTAKTLTGLNFSTALNLNGVAAIVDAALSGASVTWNANYSRFDVTSASTGTTSSVGYATATGSGTDVSSLLGLTQASGASVPVVGIAAETPIAAVQTLAGTGKWYGLAFASSDLTPTQVLAIAAYIEGSAPSRMFGVSLSNPNVLDPTNSTDLGSLLMAAGYQKTLTQFSSSSPYVVASFFGRAFTVDFTGSDTTLTMKFKTEPGVTAELLNETQAATLKAKNVNVFVAYANATAIVQEGVMAGGDFFDEVHEDDWLQDYVQNSVFNLLYTTPTKIPQTDPGVHQIVTTVEAAMAQGVVNGTFAPGVWGGPPLGALVTGQTLTKGFYVYMPPVASQSAADRAARKAPLCQVAAKSAGAVHSADVLITVNR